MDVAIILSLFFPAIESISIPLSIYPNRISYSVSQLAEPTNKTSAVIGMNSHFTQILIKKRRRRRKERKEKPIISALYLPAELPPKNFASKARSSLRMRALASATASASLCILPKPSGGR